MNHYKYKLGDSWSHDGKWWVKCLKCGEGEELCEQGVVETMNTE